MKIRTINQFAFNDEDSGPTTVGISPDRLEQIKLKMKEGDDNALAELFRSLKDIINVATDIDYLDDLQQSGSKGLLFRRRIEAGAKKAKQVQEDLDKHSEEAVIKDTNKIKNVQTAGKIIAASCEPPLDGLVEAIFNRMAESKIDYLKLQQIHANEKTEGILDDVVAKYPEVNQKLKDEFGEEAMVSDEAINNAKEDNDWMNDDWDPDSSEDWEDEEGSSEDKPTDEESEDEYAETPEKDPEVQKNFKEFLIPLDNKNASDICEGLAKAIWEDDYDPKIFEETWDAALEDNNNDLVKTGESVRSGYLKGYRQHMNAQNKNFTWVGDAYRWTSKNVKKMTSKMNRNKTLFYHEKGGYYNFVSEGSSSIKDDPGIPIESYERGGDFIVTKNPTIDSKLFNTIYDRLMKSSNPDDPDLGFRLSLALKSTPKQIPVIDKDTLLDRTYIKDNIILQLAYDKDRYTRSLTKKELDEAENDAKDKFKDYKGKDKDKKIKDEKDRLINVALTARDMYREGIIIINEPIDYKNNPAIKMVDVNPKSGLYRRYLEFASTNKRGIMVISKDEKIGKYVAAFYITGSVSDGSTGNTPACAFYQYETMGNNGNQKLGYPVTIGFNLLTYTTIGNMLKGSVRTWSKLWLGRKDKYIKVFSELENKAKEYAFTLAKEIFGDKADKEISDKVAENALNEGSDESEVMGIIKNSMR